MTYQWHRHDGLDDLVKRVNNVLRKILIHSGGIILLFSLGFGAGYLTSSRNKPTVPTSSDNSGYVAEIVKRTREYITRERAVLTKKREELKRERTNLITERARFERERELANTEREGARQLREILEKIRDLSKVAE